MTSHRLKAAVVQAGSVLFDAAACLDKAETRIRRAAGKGAGLVVLPEAFIPGYPRGLGFGAVVGRRTSRGRELYRAYFDNSLDLSGPGVRRLRDLARELEIYLAVGISEKDAAAGRSLFCTLLVIGPEGTVEGRHRKIKPTGTERTIWAEGRQGLFPVIPTPAGRMGGLICWENYMPLARMALYRQGIDIYLAPTADCREGWQCTLRHIALEGRCYVLGVNQYLSADSVPREFPGGESPAPEDQECRGGSVIFSPLGEPLAGPLYDREGTLFADLDSGEITRARFDFDPAGHYHRPDLFTFDTRS